MPRTELFETRPQDVAVDAMLNFLRELFKEHPTLTYDDDPQLTKIRICDIYALRIENPELFPCIAVRRLAFGWQKPIIGRQDRASVDFKTGSRKQIDLIRGGVVVQCISKSGLEAEQLAAIVFQALIMFKEDFYAQGVFVIDSISLSEEQPIELSAEVETVMVTVDVRTVSPISWTLSPETSDLFGNFRIEMRVIGMPVPSPVSDMIVEIVDPL